jgi:hypothetical protein
MVTRLQTHGGQQETAGTDALAWALADRPDLALGLLAAASPPGDRPVPPAPPPSASECRVGGVLGVLAAVALLLSAAAALCPWAEGREVAGEARRALQTVTPCRPA